MTIYANMQSVVHSEDEKNVLEVINQERKKLNLQPLELLDNLTKTTDLIINEAKKYTNVNQYMNVLKNKNIDSVLQYNNIENYKKLFQNFSSAGGGGVLLPI